MRIKTLFPIFFFLFLASFIIVNVNASETIPESYIYGSTASGTSWTNPTNSIDNDTGTYAQSPVATAGQWTSKLTITLNSQCTGTKLRAWVSQSNAGTYTTLNITVSPDGSSWTTIYSGTPTEGSYQNYTFSSTSYSYIGFERYRPSGTNNRYHRVNEVQGVNASYVIPSTSSFELEETSIISYSQYKSMQIYKTNIDSATITSSLYWFRTVVFSLSDSVIASYNLLKNMIIYKTIIDESNILYDFMSNKNIINIVSDLLIINYNNYINKQLYKIFNDSPQIIRSLTTYKLTGIVFTEVVISQLSTINSELFYTRNFNRILLDTVNFISNLYHSKILYFHMSESIFNVVGIRNPNFIVAPIWINPVYTQPTISNYVVQEYMLLSIVVSMFIALLAIIIVKRR